MFEKHRNPKQDTEQSQESQETVKTPTSPPVTSGRAAVIGPGIKISGDISGDENLIVEGKVDGKIKLASYQVDVGQSGQVHADITAKVIKISGEVRGDLTGTEKVVISRSGNVHGNIVAPRMTLEDGAIFKGSIDMDPGMPEKPVASTPPAKKTAQKPETKSEVKPKVSAGEKSKESASYKLSSG